MTVAEGLPPARRVFVIHNPVSGVRRRRRYRAVLAALVERGCTVVVRDTERRGDAEAFARAARDCDVVVVAGGDGTLNEAANGLPPGLPLGVIPLGTANVVAAELRLPRSPRALAAIIATAAPRAVLPGVVNGTKFLLMVGVGFDARVVAAVTPVRKRWLGKAAYVLAAMMALARPRLPQYRIVADGIPFAAASVIVTRAKCYGGAFVLAPAAGLDRTGLQICVLEQGSRAALLAVAWALATGTAARSSAIRFVSAQRVRVAGPPGDPVQTDGDHFGSLPVQIGVSDEPILMLAPG